MSHFASCTRLENKMKTFVAVLVFLAIAGTKPHPEIGRHIWWTLSVSRSNPKKRWIGRPTPAAPPISDYERGMEQGPNIGFP